MLFPPTVRYSLFLLFFVLPAFSWGQSPEISTTAAEVVVTGTKFARPAAESPQHITIIDSARIAQAADLAQLLGEQTGIVINGAYSNPGKDRSVFLRNGANQYTLILVDGQPLTDPSSLGGAVDLRLLSLAGIERIEILRGARSLLYGSDAVAGVINLITRKNTAPDPFTLHLRAAAQSMRTVASTLALSGTTQQFDYRLSYDFFDTGGISEAVAPEDSPVAFGKDGSRRQTFAGTVAYRPHENLVLRPGLRVAGFSGNYDAGAFQDADNRYQNQLLLPSLAIDYQKGKSEISARYALAKTDRTFTDATYGLSEFYGRSQQAEVFWNYRLAPAVTLTTGTQVRREQLGLRQNAPTITTTTSPYLQLNLGLKEKWHVEAGYRYNFHTEFGGQFNYSVALGHQSTPVWSQRIAVSSAFQSPTPDQLFGPFGANPFLAPQVANAIEAGSSLRHEEGLFAFTLNAFRRRISNIITYDFSAGYQNRDELLDHGLEFSGRGQLGRRFSLLGNVTYVKGKQTSPDGSGGTLTSDQFFRRPRLSGHLALTFTAKAPFTARLSADYTGERPDLWFDGAFNSFNVELSPYLIVNAYAEYRFPTAKNLRLFLDVKNLTNTDFVEVTGFSTIRTVVRAGVSLTL